MTVTQPDLFGDYDAAQERRRLYSQPATCPRCGKHEPNGWLLRNNHGIDPEELDKICGYGPEHPIYGPHCTAQYLITNHIIYAYRTGNAWLLEDSSAKARALNLNPEEILAAAKEQAS